MFLIAITLILAGLPCAPAHHNSTDVLQYMPRMYDMDDYGACRQQGKTFCETAAFFATTQNDSEIWKYIVESRQEVYKYSKDRVYRGLCVPRDVQAGQIERYLQKRIEQEIQNVSLQIVKSDVFICKPQIELYSSDYVRVVLFSLYLLFVGYATYYDRGTRSDVDKDSSSRNKYLLAFSLLSNNEKVRKPIQNKFYNDLKSIQGIRTYNMALVVMGHSLMNFFMVYCQNPHYLEKMLENVSMFFTWGMFLVQPFFLFSGWFVMLHIHQTLEKNGSIPTIDYFKMLMFRVLRLWPNMIFMMIIHSSRFPSLFYDGAQSFVMESDHMSCTKNWKYTLMFVTNFMPYVEVCNLATWYLSADTQNFIISLVVLYVIIKFKLPIIRSLLIFFIASCVLQMSIMYYHNLDLIYRVSPDNFNIYNTLTIYDPLLYHWYLSAVSNTPSFSLGLLFASIYFQYREKKFFDSPLMKLVWFFGFFGTSFVAVYLATLHYNAVLTALLGAILKPMYSLGIAIGVLGMAQGVGGLIKRICEWRLAEVLAQTTYSVYLYHVVFVFERMFTNRSLDIIVWTDMLYTSLANVVKCFSVAYTLNLLIELPFSNLLTLAAKSSNARKKVD